MTRPDLDLALRVLSDPGHAKRLGLTEWDLLVRQARMAGVLARVGVFVEGELGNLETAVPAGPAAHVRAESILGQAQRAEVQREAKLICGALSSLGIRTVFLKGAGYVLGNLPAAAGRIFSDIDILVPKDALAHVEATLMLSGWGMTHHSEYDQHYYRAWMHELPPMQHLARGTMLDIHHSILPQTARRQPDVASLIADAMPVEGIPGAFVLAPVDMVLHGMTHLFSNEEFSHGLRDLSDIDLLLRHFGGVSGFWDELPRRARQQGLERPLFYGLRYAQLVLGTPIPPAVIAAVQPSAPAMLPLMDVLWRRALRSPHRTSALPMTTLALFALYVRSHWMRMPTPMLLRHILVKGWRRVTEAEEPVL